MCHRQAAIATAETTEAACSPKALLNAQRQAILGRPHIQAVIEHCCTTLQACYIGKSPLRIFLDRELDTDEAKALEYHFRTAPYNWPGVSYRPKNIFRKVPRIDFDPVYRSEI